MDTIDFDSMEHVVEIDLDLDLDLDNSNLDSVESNISQDNSSHNSSETVQSQVPSSFDVSDQFENAYQLEESDFSLDNESDFYEIETDSDEDEFLTYPLMNYEMTSFQNDMAHLLMYEVEDELNEWQYEEIDSGPSSGPFHSKSSCNITDLHGQPELFFNAFFDERMWTIISDATNTYARSKSRTPNGNRSTDPTHPEYKKHCQLNSWIDTTPGDIKVFIGHVLVMGLVKKADLEKYWNMNSKTRIPFFGKYMSQNHFQSILWNFHVNDDSQNPHRTHPLHDPLCKIRPFVDMCERNFLYQYKPGKALSFDEACCPFKGRLRFKVYNPQKPNRFHIKLFQISESTSGYILGFHVYTGKNLSCISNASKPLDPECTKTTKIVLRLLESTNLLDQGHHIYMDNYYTSPELFSELFYRQTYACGTVQQNRKGVPTTVKKAKLKPLQSVFLRNGPLLCLKWSGPKKKSKKKASYNSVNNSFCYRNVDTQN